MGSESRQSLFHGTIESLNPGDVVSPRDRGDVSWATSNLHGAISHTQDRIQSGLGQGSEGQHPHHGKVYEVEPLSSDSSFKPSPNRDFPEAFTSQQGFRVSRQIASVLNPDLSARKHRDPITNKPRPFGSTK